MGGPLLNLSVPRYIYVTCIALLAIQSAYGHMGGEAGEVRQKTYTALSSPDRCYDQSSTNTTKVSAKSATECCMVCLTMDCGVFHYNATTGFCHLYSDKLDMGAPEGDGITYYEKDDSRTDGWLVFVSRHDGSVDFQRPWADYRDGFGDPCSYSKPSECWLGLETLHYVTANQPYKLRAEMTDHNGNDYYAEFSTFQVGDESNNYRLSVSGYDKCSTAGDSMDIHDGMEFTTVDVDNDLWHSNCADFFEGGWWYRHCDDAHPTGLYNPQASMFGRGVTWPKAPGLPNSYSFKTMRLMIKPL